MCVSKEKQTPFHLKIPFASFSSLQFPLCRTSDRYRGNKGLFHYIIATVMCRQYLAVHKSINSVCKYLSAATRKESPLWGEDNGRNRRTVEIWFGSRSVPQSSFPGDGNVSSKGCRLYNEAMPTKEGERERHGEVRLVHRAIILPLHCHSAIYHGHTYATSPWA